MQSRAPYGIYTKQGTLIQSRTFRVRHPDIRSRAFGARHPTIQSTALGVGHPTIRSGAFGLGPTDSIQVYMENDLHNNLR